MSRIPRPKPLPAHNPGLKPSMPKGIVGTSGKTPRGIQVGEDVVKMGMSMAKSAGHKAHDILHGIGL